MKQRALYFIENYLLTVLIFIIDKLVFMLCNQDGHQFTIGDVWDVVIHGLSLDLSTALYFVILPFLVVFVSVYWCKKFILINILRVYYMLIAIAFALAFVADTSLYEFWQFKLDASCLQYLETPTEAMASVSWAYIAIRVVIFLLTFLLIYKTYWLTVRRLRAVSPQPSDWKSAAFGLLAFLVSVPLFVIGIRGGMGESTTNIGQVYYSQNQFLNHSAVNPVFSFFASFERTASVNTVYHFMEDDECNNIIKELYNTESVGSDTLLTTQMPNIILILLEGCGGGFTEIGDRKDVTPNLNRLMHEGICFSNCYGNTWRTDRGTLCTWSGYPSFPTMSVMKIPSKSRTLPNIAKTLHVERGYKTHYLYGGDINFTNMRSYLIEGGFEALTWKKDYARNEQETAQWGVRDDITFGTLYQLATSMPQPFLIGFSTLSSHAPWDVPIEKFDDEVLNAFYYLDQCVGQFVEKFCKSDVWKNTLVVMLSDHGIPYNKIDESDPLMNHIPMIWIGGAVKEPKRIEKVCNQTDLPATLLAQLGLSHTAFSFSRDVLSKTYIYPFAINTYTEGFSVVDSVSFMNYDLISDRVAAEVGKKNPRLPQIGKAILQAASKDLDKR